jgi:hypothetical protein
MALDNAIVWIFSPDLGEIHEFGDVAHSTIDNNLTWPSGTRFDPTDASMGELRRAARQFFNLAPNEVNALNVAPGDIAIAPAAEWAHICDAIYIAIHNDFDGADEVLLPALAQTRLASINSISRRSSYTRAAERLGPTRSRVSPAAASPGPGSPGRSPVVGEYLSRAASCGGLSERRRRRPSP